MKRLRGNSKWHVFDNVYPNTRRKPEEIVEEVDVHEITESEIFETVVAEERKICKESKHASTSMKSTEDVDPYDFPFIREMLQEAPSDSLLPLDMCTHAKDMREFVQVVPRAYENEYLREPLKKERCCAMDEKCEGLKIYAMGSNRFILREFLLPSEAKQAKKDGHLPKERRLCLLCKRTEIEKAFYNIKMDGMAVKHKVILSDYRNIVGVPGEYCIEDTIVTSTKKYEGLLDPVVLHSRDLYKIVTEDGVRKLVQWRLPSPGGKRCLH